MAFSPHVAATVLDSSVASDGKGNVVMYTLHCSCIGARKQLLWWQVAHRFREFVAFHARLKAAWTLRDVPVPKLPPKHLKLFGSDVSAKLREERTELLSIYLETVSKYHPTLAQQDFVHEFFGLNMEVAAAAPAGEANPAAGPLDLVNVSLSSLLSSFEATAAGAVTLRPSRTASMLEDVTPFLLGESDGEEEEEEEVGAVLGTSAATFPTPAEIPEAQVPACTLAVIEEVQEPDENPQAALVPAASAASLGHSSSSLNDSADTVGTLVHVTDGDAIENYTRGPGPCDWLSVWGDDGPSGVPCVVVSLAANTSGGSAGAGKAGKKRRKRTRGGQKHSPKAAQPLLVLQTKQALPQAKPQPKQPQGKQPTAVVIQGNQPTALVVQVKQQKAPVIPVKQPLHKAPLPKQAQPQPKAPQPQAQPKAQPQPQAKQPQSKAKAHPQPKAEAKSKQPQPPHTPRVVFKQLQPQSDKAAQPQRLASVYAALSASAPRTPQRASFCVPASSWRVSTPRGITPTRSCLHMVRAKEEEEEGMDKGKEKKGKGKARRQRWKGKVVSVVEV